MSWQSPITERYDELRDFHTRTQGQWAVALDDIWQCWVLTTQRRDKYVGHMPLVFSKGAQQYVDALQFTDFTYTGGPLMPQLNNAILDEVITDHWHAYPEDSGAQKNQLGYALTRFLPEKTGRTELITELCEAGAAYAATVERRQLRIAVRAYGPDYAAPYGPHEDLPISEFSAALYIKGPTTWQAKPTDLNGRVTDNSLPEISREGLTGAFATQAQRYGQAAPQSFSIWSGNQTHTECPVQGQMRLAMFLFADVGGNRAPINFRRAPSNYRSYSPSR